MTLLFRKRGERRGFLARLARDKAGNTLALMAIFLIPLAGLVGSAVDISRLYVVKVRLQQACDAGALAGRKFMNDDGGALSDKASDQAKAFFTNNFVDGWMTTHDTKFTPTKTADSQVHGEAEAMVPMAIMGMFGVKDTKLTVSCEARYDVADTDVMFVLDTTGSMACTTAHSTSGCSQPIKTYTRPDNGTTGYYTQEENGSKISGLRSAVLNFYDTLKQYADPTTHIRYGFVTYTSTVNAGKAVTDLSSSYMVSKWPYQTRRVVDDAFLKNNSSKTVKASSRDDCMKNYSRTPATYQATDPDGGTYTVFPYDSNGKATAIDPAWKNSTCTLNTDTVTPVWRYAQFTLDVSKFVTGVPVTDPSKITGETTTWNGCVEERTTTPGASSFSQSALPADLDPDLIPSDDDSRWRPMWQEVVYYRGNSNSTDSAGGSSNPYGDTTSGSQGGTYTPMMAYQNIASGYVSCGKPVKRLGEMTRDDVVKYVNAVDFVPQGGTYHDTGMIWGTRMIAPKGVFAADTAPWSGRNPPNRYIVFMTDGDMAPNSSIYGMYGMERYDQRVTGGTLSKDEDYHNARFVAECQAAQARHITVFVIGFGQTLTQQLKDCASPGPGDDGQKYAFYADSNDKLNAAFTNIAKQVAMLRVSK